LALLQSEAIQLALDSTVLTGVLKRTVPTIDRILLKASQGWVATGLQTVVLMETVGARSGLRRETVTLCMPVGRDLVLVGSNWGRETDPAWVHNIRANPEVKVTFRGYRGTAEDRELQVGERRQMWESAVRYNPQYAVYQDNVSRSIPVILLEMTR
jgi:deazaflavin-dependent oxidoreductase (nitroreductase family)